MSPSTNMTLLHGRPDGLLFDLDGVLADITHSYRAAIVGTASAFGMTVRQDEVDRIKNIGDANNDWILTYRLLTDAGIDVAYQDVVTQFQKLYLGNEAGARDGSAPEAAASCAHDSKPGARESEFLLVNPDLLPRLAKSFPLAIVTGRPRAEAEWFLNRYQLAPLFNAVIAMEDAPAKPDPAPIRQAMCKLGACDPWMIGDTPDDISAAAGAGIQGIGIDGDDIGRRNALVAAGASVVLSSANMLADILL